MAGVDNADADLARERRPQGFSFHHRSLLCHLRAFALEIGGVGIDLRLADHFGRELRLVAFVNGGGEVGGCLERAQLGDVRLRVQLGQDLPRLHLVSGFEIDAADQAGHLCRDVNAARCPKRADCTELWLPLLKVSLHGAHR